MHYITSEDPKRGPIYTAYIPTSMLYNIHFLLVTSFQLTVAAIKKFPFRFYVTLKAGLQYDARSQRRVTSSERLRSVLLRSVLPATVLFTIRNYVRRATSS